ncbi:tRNA-ribosyltransferase family protein [Sporobolomyces koalae]|uniref:tRNA-ribosyltransferase family protein n=1 Tax=Sporobolomyces koalae TaxID=500713 RepID=UPI00316C675E
MTPTFMPVATQATMKGVTPAQLESITPPITLILNNTYHLSQNPGTRVLDACDGASHGYQGWRGNLLTDSGGFQMVSLVKLSRVTEEGVLFANPYDPSLSSLLTPEKSMQIQHSIGADIMMQLDDVVASLTTGERMEEAMWRSIRWLDRCIAEHEQSGRTDRQNLFAIVQGGLDHDLRDKCLRAMLEPERESKLPGYAIGGLSGGEEKSVFWRIIAQCAQGLPENKPRYSMGIGYGEDLLVCAALGVDMADCVFPTRTARFGVALTFGGPVNLRQTSMADDFSVIDSTCPCATCLNGQGLSRALLWTQTGKEAAGASAVTVHNLTYQSRLMNGARNAILEDRFPQYLIDFFDGYYRDKAKYP